MTMTTSPSALLLSGVLWLSVFGLAVVVRTAEAQVGVNKAWHELLGSSTFEPLYAPQKRYGQASMTMNMEKLYWEFGGVGEDGQLLGNTWVYDFTWDIWELKHAADNALSNIPTPPPRAYASLAMVSTRVFLYGGMCETHPEPAGGKPCSDDLWVYDLLTNQRPWTRVDYVVGGVKPPPRSGHVALSFGSSMYIYGGSGGAQYGREVDHTENYRGIVWEYKYANVQWVKHYSASGAPPPAAFGMAGTLHVELGKMSLLVHGGMHPCQGLCAASDGAQTGLSSSVMSELHVFDLATAAWTTYNLTIAPSRAFHAMHLHKEVDGVKSLFLFGGWGHSATNSPSNVQLSAFPVMNNDLWQLYLGGLSLNSIWKQFFPATPVTPQARMAAGVNYLGGSAPSFVVAGGRGCDVTNYTLLGECEEALDDLWLFDLWGWMAGEGTVTINSMLDGQLYIPDSLMLLEGEAIAGERKGLSTAIFREVLNGEVVGLAWEHGMVVGKASTELTAGGDVTLDLALTNPVYHTFELLKEDKATAIPDARVTIEVWDPNYIQDFQGGWRPYQPALTDNGGELFTNFLGQVYARLLPTEWEGLPSQLRSKYRVTCSMGTAQVFQADSFTVQEGAAPIFGELVSYTSPTPAFAVRLPPVTLGAGESSEPVRTGGDMVPYEYRYLDLHFDFVRVGQEAVVQVLTIEEEKNAFAIFSADPAIEIYPGESKHTYSACTSGPGMGFAGDPYDSSKTYPMCRLAWSFTQGVANFKMRVGIVLWKTLADTEDPLPTDKAAFRAEVFYHDVTPVVQAPAPDQGFINEEVDAYEKGTDFVLLAVSMTLALGACIGIVILCELARRRQRRQKFQQLKARDMLLFNRPNADIDMLVAHEMDHALKTAPHVAGERYQREMLLIPPRHDDPEEDNPYASAHRKGTMPLGLRSQFQQGSGSTPRTDGPQDGVQGFMDNLEAMADEYRQGLLGGGGDVARMSKAEAIDALSSRYTALYEEKRAAASDSVAASAVVMPKPPPRAPPGIAPPPRPGSAGSDASAAEIRPSDLPAPPAQSSATALLVGEGQATGRRQPQSPPMVTKAPRGIHPPPRSQQGPPQPAAATPQSPGPSMVQASPAGGMNPSPSPAPQSSSWLAPTMPQPWESPPLSGKAVPAGTPSASHQGSAGHSEGGHSPGHQGRVSPGSVTSPGQQPATASSPVRLPPPPAQHPHHSPSPSKATRLSPLGHRSPGSSAPLAPPPQHGMLGVLAPPPPPGHARAIWVGSGSPPPPPPPPPPQAVAGQGPLQPPGGGGGGGGGPHGSGPQRVAALPPMLSREQMSEEELVAMRLRALGGVDSISGGGTGRPGNRRRSSSGR